MGENTSKLRSRLAPITFTTIAVNGILSVLGGYWFYQILSMVPEPYLDEVFHIRQAQAYWANQWNVWDPKITTPPGLYLLSYPWLWILKISAVPTGVVTKLRGLNLAEAVFVLFFLVRELLGYNSSQKRSSTFMLEHAALNVCLFPPLFFFYGLYYTDVLSAGIVLHAYVHYHAKRKTRMLITCVMALFLRQTNIFWVAVYLGGLEVLRTIKKGRPGVEFPCKNTFSDVIHGSWDHASLYDPLISEASLEDYVKSTISLFVAVLANFQAVFQALTTYLLLIAGFGTFLYWNGGVVLGDKDNHIASLHLSQMLYIWPYFMFFSFPLLYSYLLNAIIPQTSLPAALSTGSTRQQLPRLTTAIPIISIMLAIVHFNTLVHPFTLADNRHYVFYVFRLLLRHPSVKYLVVPIYFICAWAAITALGGLPGTDAPKDPHAKEANRNETRLRLPPAAPTLAEGNRISFVIVWAIATALSLTTAPLVEPRYYIIPWLMWRLHLPIQDPPLPNGADRLTTEKGGRMPTLEVLGSKKHKHNHRLWFESVWFLAINWATGYIFLHWGFAWPQEPGRVQRFMW